ncbi:MAG: serine hydroxymethyltransferase [Coriobacteriales bacterium]|jgi:glycine hydroxymethyltransferase
MDYTELKATDPEVAKILDEELARQRDSIELIASENFTSPSVMEAMGSVLTNKYAEGYPGKRYYGGCEEVDIAENLAIERVCKLFGSKYANVQAHSGSGANMAAYMAVMKDGDTILGMALDNGGHLSHGAKVSFSGKVYHSVSYGVDPETERIDMDEVARIAEMCRPQVIVAGASAYPRTIDFKAFAEVAHNVGAYLIVDMAHIAGLIAAGYHPTPVGVADIVTSTSHKTMRGPRGGFILTDDEELIKNINKAIFPGIQGGPLMHVIAAKAVAFGEALKPEFKDYIGKVVENAAQLGKGMTDGGLRLVSGGTDNHLCLVDLTPAGTTGKEAEEVLGSVGITCNKNTIPNEKQPASIASGVRIGSPAMTTRGFDADESYRIGQLIAKTVFNRNDQKVLDSISAEVADMLKKHPLYPELG